jgi:hypothetical protein
MKSEISENGTGAVGGGVIDSFKNVWNGAKKPTPIEYKKTFRIDGNNKQIVPQIFEIDSSDEFICIEVRSNKPSQKNPDFTVFLQFNINDDSQKNSRHELILFRTNETQVLLSPPPISRVRDTPTQIIMHPTSMVSLLTNADSTNSIVAIIKVRGYGNHNSALNILNKQFEDPNRNGVKHPSLGKLVLGLIGNHNTDDYHTLVIPDDINIHRLVNNPTKFEVDRDTKKIKFKLSNKQMRYMQIILNSQLPIKDIYIPVISQVNDILNIPVNIMSSFPNNPTRVEMNPESKIFITKSQTKTLVVATIIMKDDQQDTPHSSEIASHGQYDKLSPGQKNEEIPDDEHSNRENGRQIIKPDPERLKIFSDLQIKFNDLAVKAIIELRDILFNASKSNSNTLYLEGMDLLDSVLDLMIYKLYALEYNLNVDYKQYYEYYGTLKSKKPNP